MKQCRRLRAIKAIKLTVAWSLNCLHVIVEVYRLRCPGELTKDLTLKAKANYIAAFCLQLRKRTCPQRTALRYRHY